VTATGALALTLTAALTAFAGGAQPAVAGSVNPGIGVVPPADAQSLVGKNYAELSVDWWKYVSARPAPVNPLADQTGAMCNEGQSGTVFFLVGVLGSGSAARECTVPAGKPLFIPLANAINVHEPGVDEADTPQELWGVLAPLFGVAGLHATIDGLPVGNLVPASTPYRACAGPAEPCGTGAFSILIPGESVFDSSEHNVAAGIFEPAVADGYYLLLRPLTPGGHVITFGGEGTFAGSGFIQDITYHLAVR
jgi:hypothetical protein